MIDPEDCPHEHTRTVRSSGGDGMAMYDLFVVMCDDCDAELGEDEFDD